MDYEFHPLAELMGPIDEDRVSDLAEAIAKDGQLLPIILNEGKIIDGRHRYLACKRVGVEPTIEHGELNDDEAKRVVAHLNLNRRHMTAAQKAQAVIDLERYGVPATETVQKLDVSPRTLATVRTVNAAAEKQPQHSNVVELVRRGDLSAERAEAVVTGDMSLEAAMIDRRRSVGRPRGNSHLLRLFNAMSALDECVPAEAKIVEAWTGDPDRIKQLARCTRFLNRLVKLTEETNLAATGS